MKTNEGRRYNIIKIFGIMVLVFILINSFPSSGDTWDYSSPVWWEREQVEIERYRTIEEPNWSGYYADDYFQVQWWNSISQYSPPGGGWIGFSHNYRRRDGDPNLDTGEPESWRSWDYRDWERWYFSVSKWDNTWREEYLQFQWWLEGEGHPHTKARFGYRILPTLQGKIPKIFIVDITSAYDDDIDYYALNGVPPDPVRGSYLIMVKGRYSLI